ncbi:hypothetical protein Tco_1367466 [Tanacetum coccineum]
MSSNSEKEKTPQEEEYSKSLHYWGSGEKKAMQKFVLLTATSNQNRGNQVGNGEAGERAYALGGGEVNQDPNVVTGAFLLNNRYGSILFDNGADWGKNPTFIPPLSPPRFHQIRWRFATLATVVVANDGGQVRKTVCATGLEVFESHVQCALRVWTSSEPSAFVQDSRAMLFDDDEVKGSGYKVTYASRNKNKNDFVDSGGIENHDVQELEHYAAYKSEETTKTVNSALKIAETYEKMPLTMITLHQQGEQITRTHMATADIEQAGPREIRRGEDIAWYADGETILRNEDTPSISYAYGRV